MAAFKLNPNAKEWHPSVECSQENRCLYITFSNGFPLSEFQIRCFFTAWGFDRYIEQIDIHQPRNGYPPLFGKITFKSISVPVMILKGEEQAKFCVDGRTVWCKKFNRRNMGP